MKNRIIVLLIVLTLSLVSGLGLTAAQESATLKAIALTATPLLSAPAADAEPVLGEDGATPVEVAANEVVVVLGTDGTMAFLEVEAAGGTGYVPAENFVVFSPAALASKALVTSSEDNPKAVFAAPDLASEYLGAVPAGSVVTVLGSTDEFLYVAGADGLAGWTVGSAYEPLAADAYLATVALNSNPELGIFAEANVTSDIVTSVANGAWLYVTGPAEGQLSPILTQDGLTGYAVTSDLSPLPMVMVETSVSQAQVGIYVEPNQTADLLGTLGNGEVLYYVEAVDDYWTHIYSPVLGDGYALNVNLGTPFAIATVEVDGSNVRTCDNSDTCDVITQLNAGDKVIVTGINAAGDWVAVTVPFDQILYPYRGVNGWMANFLFESAPGELSFDPSVLAAQ